MGTVQANRLSKETSPYLLQHQHNPVDWFPWGEEAFETARRENKPIFLSVGYSTCYWCHVMERQCFENPAIAAEMNRLFVNIKVDREERPDIDQIYMTAVQVLTRQGGWPMSVFLLPDLRPFYGGTYFPPTDSYGRPGFPTLLRSLEDAYRNRAKDVQKSAVQIMDILQHLAEPGANESSFTMNDEWIDSLITRSTVDYDSRHGGFGGAPKFPRQTLLEMLLVHNRKHPDDRRMAMFTHTLDALAHGGIRDQLGGGFHRYSTDAEWLVPHFEIMLYDNAMLAWCYVEAFAQTQDQRYATVARGVFDFVLREMTTPSGAFFTAFDAEVDAQEGLSYLWTRSEIEATLGEVLDKDPACEAKISRFCRVYGLDLGPNFADPHHGNGQPDKNILFLAEPDDGDRLAIMDDELKQLREILLAERKTRKQPLLDTKILTSWNALMIRALAYGGQVLGEPRYVEAAETAITFLLATHRDAEGNLFRTSRDGVTKHAAFLDDYAFVAQAMLALYDAGANEKWEDEARTMLSIMKRKFGDEQNGGFFFTQPNAADVIVRQKTGGDSPLPSGNGVAALVQLSLGELEAAKKTIARFAGQLQQNAEGMSTLVQAVDLFVQQNGEIVIGTQEESESSTVGAEVLTPEQVASKIVALSGEWIEGGILNVHLKILGGFHINAHEASAGLLATQISVAGADAPQVTAIDYPTGALRPFAFAEEPIRVYDGDTVIAVRFAGQLESGSYVDLGVRYQACNDTECLVPVTRTLRVRVP